MTALFVIISLILLSSMFQEKTDDMVSGLVLILPVCAHEIAGAYMGGWTYYISDIALGLIAIWLLSVLKRSKLSQVLAESVLVAMILNIVGFCMWYSGMSPQAYNISFLVYYSWILYILISKGGLCVGLAKTCGNLLGLRGDVFERAFDSRKDEAWKKQAH